MSLSKSDISAVAEIVRAVIAEDSPQETGVKVVASDPKPSRNRGKVGKGKVSPKGKSPRKSPKVAKGCLTAGEAWTLLGADEDYIPRDPDAPATGPQLWRLNSTGMLQTR